MPTKVLFYSAAPVVCGIIHVSDKSSTFLQTVIKVAGTFHVPSAIEPPIVFEPNTHGKPVISCRRHVMPTVS